MHSQVLLRWLVRRACTPGVLSSSQIGMTVHALRQLGALTVSSATTSPLNVLPVIQTLCVAADGRSQANVLHALACATTEQCSPRVTVQTELCSTLQLLQGRLVETAVSLTAPETILVMEALIKLAPFAGRDGPLINRRLLDEVQERSMALASVVERPVDLLGVTRVVVEAVTSVPFTAPSSSLSIQPFTSMGTASWADVTLENVLRVVQARLSSFSNQDLISLVDVLTVARVPAATEAVAADSLPVSASSSPSLPRAPTEKQQASDTAAGGAREKYTFLDAARFLLDDLLGRAFLTVPNLSVAQLSAWLTRLVKLHLTDHQLLRTVVQSLAAAAREQGSFTDAQLSSSVHALAALFSTTVTGTEKWTDKELYAKAYVEILHELVKRLHQRPRCDPTGLAHAQTYLLPLLFNVPEVALNAYLQQAELLDRRMSMPTAALTPSNSSPQVRVFVLLSASLEMGAALLLRHFHELAPRVQAHVAAFVFHWHLYLPQPKADAKAESDSTAGAESPLGSPVTTPKAVEMVRRCSFMTADEASRKHRAVCGLLEGCLANFGAKDAVQVLNEVVVLHYAQPGQRRQQQQSKCMSSPAERNTAATATAVEAGLPEDDTSAMQEDAARQRRELLAHLSAKIGGSLQGELKEMHTAQLVRYLTSLSKMATRVQAPYNTVLLALKGRSLTSFEQISVLGVLARHHLRSPYVVYGVVRDLPQLGQTLHNSQKAALLKYLGQAGAQRLVKAPCAEGLMPGVLFSDATEVTQLSLLELVFAFIGLVELRQNANPTTSQVLQELAQRVSLTHDSDKLGGPLSHRHVFYPVRSPTTLAELVTSLCRYGGPSKGVTAPLLVEAMRALQLRVATSRSLFVDVSQLTWHWPLVEEYFQPSSVLWGGGTPPETFSSDEWSELRAAFQRLCSTAQRQLRSRLTDIALSPRLRRNTFLWNQMACGVRFDALPPQGSPEVALLWENLERKDIVPLHASPQQLLDVMTLAVYRLPEDAADAMLMLDLVKKHVASLPVQNGLQVWWYASQYLSSANHASSQEEKVRRLVQAVRDAAKQHVVCEDKAVAEKLSMMEQRLFQALV
ncbi:hypothetical protein ABB37_01338 [Leptomonas pyrrhocoris]|uniref:Uncharacterized protein n=1 Tax=Leptomonas pyrrhocoris TaxID=157538 RepID=A0A0M9G8E1_LEPPY|nr:hypothetical protein ABB37_01338 [Leptomonas pyrrhocoris]KPA84880.1 hypothetical protein ABB37_01338 [Leptomonas pyrrhocoris]|eukprot:XP_015663319.1 hypothetical protein ABB37_01338 [Leptomonas pyrrhocoris]